MNEKELKKLGYIKEDFDDCDWNLIQKGKLKEGFEWVHCGSILEPGYRFLEGYRRIKWVAYKDSRWGQRTNDWVSDKRLIYLEKVFTLTQRKIEERVWVEFWMCPNDGSAVKKEKGHKKCPNCNTKKSAFYSMTLKNFQKLEK